jgi:hypothetical protein
MKGQKIGGESAIDRLLRAPVLPPRPPPGKGGSKPRKPVR